MLHDPMFVDEVNKLIARGPHQRRVGGAAGGAQDQAPVRQHPGRVLPRAPRGRGLRRRPRGAQPAGPGGGRGGGGPRRTRSSSRTTCRPADAAMLARTRAGGGLRHRPGRPDQPHRHRRARPRDARRWWARAGPREQISPGRPGRGGRHAAAWCWSTRPRSSWRCFRETHAPAPREPRQRRSQTRDLPAVDARTATASGCNGNIEFLEEIPSLLAHGAEGIGLYRTEFLFLDRHDAAHRGGALPRLPAGARGDGRPAGHHPHAGPRRRQGAAATRSTSGSPTRRWACAPSATACANRELFRAQLRALLRASACTATCG